MSEYIGEHGQVVFAGTKLLSDGVVQHVVMMHAPEISNKKESAIPNELENAEMPSRYQTKRVYALEVEDKS